ncbi:Hypothetical predicted protein [Olea europaea subsp. europaea]|uniref:Uncharacterized protein n=1 Tax=Olea europaea subsp. europaea TaxID=158383 RepID=A0A8S0UBA1_OLEEU|nr:Hypothetical predicted protein [Olea europaea subsp. europaea]
MEKAENPCQTTTPQTLTLMLGDECVAAVTPVPGTEGTLAANRCYGQCKSDGHYGGSSSAPETATAAVNLAVGEVATPGNSGKMGELVWIHHGTTVNTTPHYTKHHPSLVVVVPVLRRSDEAPQNDERLSPLQDDMKGSLWLWTAAPWVNGRKLSPAVGSRIVELTGSHPKLQILLPLSARPQFFFISRTPDYLQLQHLYRSCLFNSHSIRMSEAPFRPREVLFDKQKLFQSIHKHTYLKGPFDKITGIYNMSHGIGKKE